MAELVIDMDTNCTQCGEAGTTPNGLCLRCIGRRIVETGDITAPKPKGNVTKINSTIAAEVAHIGGVTADIVKGVMKIQIVIKLDESALAVREELGFISFDSAPVRFTITNVQGKLF